MSRLLELSLYAVITSLVVYSIHVLFNPYQMYADYQQKQWQIAELERLNAPQFESYMKTVQSMDVYDADATLRAITPRDGAMAVLRIPSIDLEEVVLRGPETAESLDLGVTFVEDYADFTQQNIGLAGHRVEGRDIQFNQLEHVSLYDEIELDFAEQTRVYEVIEIKHLDPSDTWVLAEYDAPHRITLITCDAYNPETGEFEIRSAVIAELKFAH